MPPETPETPAPATGSPLERGAEKLNSVVSGLNGSIDKLSGIIGSLGNSAGSTAGASTISIEHLQKLIEAAKGSTKDLAESLNRQFNSISTSSATRQFSMFGTSATGAFDSISKAASNMAGFVEKHAGKLGEVLGSAGLIGATRFQRAVVDKLGDATGYKKAQEHLMQIQQQALQMGVAFDGALGDAESNFNFFNRSFRESIVLTRSMPEAVMQVQKALGETFGSTGVIQNLVGLARAQDNVRVSLTATNAALLINKATGLEIPKITNMMNTAHTELGETIEGSVLAFGRIKEVADKSGIGFEHTADSIIKSTNSLKMWGGTIGAVSPLFDMFSKSLRGTGREGLTPDLLESFVGGLNKMGMSTKALLGVQAGMGGGAGAIGGALEIEEALEKGPEGMKKVVDSLTQTLTQFGGGKITTRAEAIRDPAMQNNFLMQRQLLTKLIGVDEATATKTLDALSGLSQTGLQTGSGAEDALGQLLGSGEKIADSTTTTAEKLSQNEIAAINAGSRSIIEATQTLADKLDIGAFARGIDTALEQAIISGQVNPEDIARHLSRATRDRDTARERIQETRQTGRQPSQRQISELNRSEARVEELRASRRLQEMLPRQMAEAMEKGKLTNTETVAAATTGQVPDRIMEEAFTSATQRDSDLANQIGAKMVQGKATPEEVRAFNLIGGTMENLKNAISSGVQIRPGDLNVTTDTSSLERAVEGLEMMPSGEPRALPPMPEPAVLQPPLSPAQINVVPPVQREIRSTRLDTAVTTPTREFPRREQRIPEMARAEFPRRQPMIAPATDINATRLRNEVASRQTPAPNVVQELDVQTLNADKLAIPLAFERLSQSIDDLSRQPQTRELVNATAPERAIPPIPAAISAANTARREAAETAGPPVMIPAPQGGQAREEREVLIKVTLEGDSTIKLEPIIRQVVGRMHKDSHEN